VPLTTATGWSGVVRVSNVGTIADNIATDTDATKLRVCRYTPIRDSQPAVPAGIRNEQTPLAYADVRTALTNQNFLVIKAGTGAAVNTCPADDANTVLVNGSTWHHQPYQ